MGGSARSYGKTVIEEYDCKPLPGNWEHTHLKDHIQYRGQLIKVKDQGKGMVTLRAGKFDEAIQVLGKNLDDACRKMEKELRTLT